MSARRACVRPLPAASRGAALTPALLYRLPILVLDDKASTAADAHCKEMVENAFTSHWGLNGDKPYQRYNKAGVADHVSENIVGADGEEGKPLNPDAGSVEKQMLTSQGNWLFSTYNLHAAPS